MTQEQTKKIQTKDSFAVVGIGASAGGLSALKELFRHVPADSGLAYVVVVHLSPDHESQLDKVLQPHVKIPVHQVTRTTALEPNNVYVIPPNANLEAIDTHLRLTELEKSRALRAPIDHFFRTLAETHDGQAVGIVLTGTGSDGALGLRYIKEQGGLTVAQDPVEAEYDEMPQSAIAAAQVDCVLPLSEIAGAVIGFGLTEPELTLPKGSESLESSTQQLLRDVNAALLAHTARDFSQYKPSTMLRRLFRRMQFNYVRDPDIYLALLRDNPNEALALADDLLINVTSFFRDEDVFAILEREVIPQIFERKNSGDSVRVWSVGCATGEEAYSLAMLLLEEATRRGLSVPIQVFASDLHLGSLEKAREGIYPGAIESEVSRERLDRFFEKESGSFRLKKQVRECVVFAPHNVLSDPPFSRLDLVSCRNLLIYLDRSLHAQLAELFHYALRGGGYLLVGTSESIDNAELFRTVDKKAAIYRRRDVPGPEPRLPVFPLVRERLRRASTRPPARLPAYGPLHQHLVEHYAPPSVLVSPDNNIVHSSAHASRYLVHPGGEPTANVSKLVRRELRSELQAALAEARLEGRFVRTKAIETRCEGENVFVAMDIRPALSVEQEGFVLVVFDERPLLQRTASQQPSEAQAQGVESRAADKSRINELEEQRLRADHRLQRLIEAHDASRAELKASNEELQSANEELRSTLEELETSKEELQSMNEELQAANEENRHKVEELDQLTSDLQNLLVATDIATLFLGRDNRILRFTPKVESLFSIKAADRGRSLSDFTSRLGYSELVGDVESVLRDLVPVEREVRHESGAWYLTRVLPYRDLRDHIAGVVVTFVEITRLKQAEHEVLSSKETYEHILESLPEPLLVLTPELTVHSANRAFYQDFEAKPEGTVGRSVFDLGQRQWDTPELRSRLERLVSDQARFAEHVVDQNFAGLGHKVMLLSGRWLEQLGLVLLGMHDITERHASEQALRESEERFRALALASAQLLYRMDPQWDQVEYLHNLGAVGDLENSSDKWLLGAIPAEDHARIDAAISEAIRSREPFELEHRLRRRDGSFAWTLSRAVPIVSGGKVVEWFGAATDVSERREAERQLRDSDQRKDEYLAMLGHELRNPLGAIRSSTELLLLRGSEDERSQRAYGVMARQAEHMSKILDGLLDVSRIARGKIRLDCEPVEIRDVVRDVMDVRTSHIANRGLEEHLDITAKPLWVYGDRARLTQVVDNLLSNAIKFTEAPGAVTVTVQREGGEAVIRVRDTGVGIRPELLPRIFDSFRQERQNVARSMGGLGLGLSLSKGLVRLHDGKIEAQSGGLGHGAEFIVRLRAIEAPESAGDQTSSGASEGLRILLVEDNPDVSQMLAELLRISGHKVSVAATAHAAINMVRESRVDVVLCDLGLPDMNGHDLARILRQELGLRDTLLVAITGYGQSNDRKMSEQAGFDAHLTKPVEMTAIQDVLAAHFGKET